MTVLMLTALLVFLIWRSEEGLNRLFKPTTPYNTSLVQLIFAGLGLIVWLLWCLHVIVRLPPCLGGAL